MPRSSAHVGSSRSMTISAAGLSRAMSRAAKAWQRMMQLLALLRIAQQTGETMKPAGQLAILQDVDSGALLSGGVLDMIAVKHTPVRPVPTHKLDAAAMEGTKMAVNVDPVVLTDEQKQALRAWTRPAARC